MNAPAVRQRRHYLKAIAFIVWTVAAGLTAASCCGMKVSDVRERTACRPEKITFALDSIDTNGLTGPDDGKVSVDYEFCIPLTEHSLQAVHKTDPSIACRPGPGMRIGCRADQHACIGNTGGKDYRRILCALSAREDIERIDRTWWE